jgi:transaldolase
MMKANPLLRLESFGQGIWMDFIRRETLSSGELRRLIEEDGLRGMTSNPSIFEKAIAGSHDYDDAIRALALEGKSIAEIYQALAVEDIQRAADLFHPIYDQTEGGDGFVSLEVSPGLAHDTAGTIAEARRLWAAVNRPNLMIKVPATQAGLPAIRQLTTEEINVNVTLLFGLPRYWEVAKAYIAGLEVRAAQGLPLKQIASVASFFLSRIDVLVDPVLEQVIQAGGSRGDLAAALHGQAAIASARVAYQIYKEIFAGRRFSKHATLGARAQRLLWASTSTKNPADSDVKYVEALIGPETINTMPIETLNAYRDHGDPAPRLEDGVAEASRVLERLPDVGIDLDAVTQRLEGEGVQKFITAFDNVMNTLREKRAAALHERVEGRPGSNREPEAEVGP